MNNILPFLLSLLEFLKSDKNNQYRTLRIVKKTYRQLKKEFKKDGFTDDEKAILKQLKDEILKRTLTLK